MVFSTVKLVGTQFCSEVNIYVLIHFLELNCLLKQEISFAEGRLNLFGQQLRSYAACVLSILAPYVIKGNLVKGCFPLLS